MGATGCSRDTISFREQEYLSRAETAERERDAARAEVQTLREALEQEIAAAERSAAIEEKEGGFYAMGATFAFSLTAMGATFAFSLTAKRLKNALASGEEET